MTTALRTPDLDELAEAIGIPVERWKDNCHVISLAVVQSGLLGEPGPDCRVVRGATTGYGIGGQHSWIALGRPFDPKTPIVDVTAWAWGQVGGIVRSTVANAYEGLLVRSQGHVAHGYTPGSIWAYGRPDFPEDGEGISLDTRHMTPQARDFLDMLGPLSREAWRDLVTYPHEDWPAHEICEAIAEQLPKVRVLLPIDVLAHATDRNPEGLYW